MSCTDASRLIPSIVDQFGHRHDRRLILHAQNPTQLVHYNALCTV